MRQRLEDVHQAQFAARIQQKLNAGHTEQEVRQSLEELVELRKAFNATSDDLFAML